MYSLADIATAEKSEHFGRKHEKMKDNRRLLEARNSFTTTAKEKKKYGFNEKYG